jgi:peptide/nickel transport system permease protein
VRGFLVARAGQTAFVAAFVTTLAFFLVHFAPGDPFAVSPDDPPEMAAVRAHMREVYGLNRPLAEQYPRMVLNFARGEFGESFVQARPVREVIADAIPRTLALMLPALVIGLVAGTLVGTAQGASPGSARDRVANGATAVLLAVPEFLLALLLLAVFALRLRWFPATGMVSVDLSAAASLAARFADYARHAVLPVTTLSLVVAAIVSRYQRAAVVEVMQEDFVRAVRAKGLARRRIILTHVLRRTGGTLCTVIGLLFPLLVSGAALVEFTFGWPGAGSALFLAVTSRDYPVVVALVLVGSVAVCVGSAIADLGAHRMNPATRLES